MGRPSRAHQARGAWPSTRRRHRSGGAATIELPATAREGARRALTEAIALPGRFRRNARERLVAMGLVRSGVGRQTNAIVRTGRAARLVAGLRRRRSRTALHRLGSRSLSTVAWTALGLRPKDEKMLELMPARRQTRGRTRRALRSLSAADRERVADWWRLAEQRMKTSDGDPSVPCEAVVMSVLIEMVGDAQRATPLWIAVRAGYSLRTYLARFAPSVGPLDVSDLDYDGILGLASTPVDELIDSLLGGDEVIHARLDPLASLVVTYAETEFDAVASVDPVFWDGLLQVATYQLQQNLGRVFEVETAEPVLRYGFVLRALEEASGC